jgi:quercetin dioxygenase-like cupin family protein
MDMQRSGSHPSGKRPTEYFTGLVSINPLFRACEPACAFGSTVTFEPGARTAWHSHPLGQILIVTDGGGLLQRWGGPIEDIWPGDMLWVRPGEKHWHGARESTPMTHIAIQVGRDGKVVDWLEYVGDEEYQASR